MHMHASCAARDQDGVLLMGPAGAGKSDLLLRLLDLGFALVADDQVELDGRDARPPELLAGLLEVRGLGIVRLPHRAPVRVVLGVWLGAAGGCRNAGGERPAALDAAAEQRLPRRRIDPLLGIPIVTLDPRNASAPQRVALALECALGRVSQVAGAFAP